MHPALRLLQPLAQLPLRQLGLLAEQAEEAQDGPRRRPGRSCRRGGHKPARVMHPAEEEDDLTAAREEVGRKVHELEAQDEEGTRP
jgi:hypothetical protein